MIKYIARQKKDPIKGISNFYAQIAAVEPVSLNEIAVKISSGCTVSVHDIKAVISSLQEQIVFALRDGKSVRLGDLGAFRPTIVAKPQAEETDVTGKDVERVRVRFTPSSYLKSEMSVDNPLVTFKAA